MIDSIITWLGKNWGTLASVVGVGFSAWAVVEARAARHYSRQATEQLRVRDSLESMRRAADLLHAVLDQVRAGDHNPLGDRAALIVEMRIQEARLLVIKSEVPREFDVERTGLVGALKSLEEQLARRPTRIRVQTVGAQVEALERLHT